MMSFYACGILFIRNENGRVGAPSPCYEFKTILVSIGASYYESELKPVIYKLPLVIGWNRLCFCLTRKIDLTINCLLALDVIEC